MRAALYLTILLLVGGAGGMSLGYVAHRALQESASAPPAKIEVLWGDDATGLEIEAILREASTRTATPTPTFRGPPRRLVSAARGASREETR